jgi:hypothetical protein
MAKPSKIQLLRASVTADVVQHPSDLARLYMDRHHFSRATATKYIQQLEAEGWIARSGSKTRPIFSPGYKRKIEKTYEISGLEEDQVWRKDFYPYFQFLPNILSIVTYGFTEMLNNAIDHSEGKFVYICAEQTEEKILLIIADNGIGIFAKIAKAMKFPDMRLAFFELSKGKFTTDPKRHSGEGIFFTSRMFDRFCISANKLDFDHDVDRDNDSFGEITEDFGSGTKVLMVIALNSNRVAKDIFDEYTNVPDDYEFSKTIVSMKLAQYGDELLMSRSQAKRLVTRFDLFKKVVLDFDGVEEVGQAFADELFRVYAIAHPDVELVPINMTRQVEKMRLRAIATRDYRD